MRSLKVLFFVCIVALSAIEVSAQSSSGSVFEEGLLDTITDEFEFATQTWYPRFKGVRSLSPTTPVCHRTVLERHTSLAQERGLSTGSFALPLFSFLLSGFISLPSTTLMSGQPRSSTHFEK